MAHTLLAYWRGLLGAVAGQLLNGARACVRDGLAAREQEELVERLEELETLVAARKERP